MYRYLSQCRAFRSKASLLLSKSDFHGAIFIFVVVHSTLLGSLIRREEEIVNRNRLDNLAGRNCK